jgi:hypothetical protein
MHIVVCIKQVPDSAQIRVHPVTNTIMRQGVPAIVNPYDLFALEEALRLKDQFGGRVTMLCMGPPQAEDALRKCISFGATDAILVTDRAFAGADTLATSATRWPRRSARSARSRRSTWSSPASRPSTATPRRSAPASPSAWAEPADLREQDRRGRPRRPPLTVERRAEGGVQLLRDHAALADHHARRHQRDALRQHGRHAARRPLPGAQVEQGRRRHRGRQQDRPEGQPHHRQQGVRPTPRTRRPRCRWWPTAHPSTTSA